MAIQRTTYQGWDEAFRLSNGTVELVVVPAVARIMHYGYEGGPNVLWTNPAVTGTAPTPGGDWVNFGGHKVWIWPQGAWPERTGIAWPPAMDLPGAIHHEAEIRDALELELTSPPIPGFGARIGRTIRLAPEGTRVTLTNTIENLPPPGDHPMAAWTISQLPADGAILGRLLPGNRLESGYRLHDPVPWSVARLGDDILHIQRPGDRCAKMGFDGDLLAWTKGDILYVERTLDTDPLSEFSEGDRAQVYGHLDGDPGLPPGPSYVELELTSPLRMPRASDTVTLTTSIELHRLGPDERGLEAVADRLRRLR